MKDKIAKLPKWAQEHIAKLESDRRALSIRVESDVKTNTYVRSLGGGIRYLDNFVSVRLNDDGENDQWYDVRVEKGELVVMCGRSALVRLEASNTFSVVIK